MQKEMDDEMETTLRVKGLRCLIPNCRSWTRLWYKEFAARTKALHDPFRISRTADPNNPNIALI